MPDKLENTSRPWAKIAQMWSTYFTPPSRISPEEKGRYRHYLKSLRSSNIPQRALVLGVTPELREILFELEYQVTCIDMSLDMILAMSDLLTKTDASEVLIKANWLDNPLRDRHYAVVLGDAVFPNIPFAFRPRLLQEICRTCMPGGVFLTRAFCAPEKRRFLDCSEILKSFEGRADTECAALELVLELQLHCWSSLDHIGSFRKAKALLDQYHESNGDRFTDPALQKVHDLVCSFWFDGFLDKIFLYATRIEEEELYRQFFTVEDVFEARDHPYASITPMYLLRNS